MVFFSPTCKRHEGRLWASLAQTSGAPGFQTNRSNRKDFPRKTAEVVEGFRILEMLGWRGSVQPPDPSGPARLGFIEDGFPTEHVEVPVHRWTSDSCWTLWVLFTQELYGISKMFLFYLVFWAVKGQLERVWSEVGLAQCSGWMADC